MSPRAIDLICRAADVDEALFTADEVAGWPRAAVEQLRVLNVLRQADTATHVECDACADRHVEKVDQISYPDGNVRFFIYCPEAGRVEVPSARLLQWAFDYGAFAKHVATATSAQGSPTCVVPDRVWRLGAVKLAGRSRGMFLVRGLLWPDAADVLAEARIRRDAVVFVAGILPDNAFWGEKPPHVAALADVAMLDADGLRVDMEHIDAQVELTEQVPKKKVLKKRSSRAGTIDRLTREMKKFLRDAKRRAMETMKRPSGPELLPRPTKTQLATLCGVSKGNVTLCFQDDSAALLRILYERAGTFDGVMSYKVK
jgi:hypothetical protein